jgi:Cu/Ag efflux pump CusA
MMTSTGVLFGFLPLALNLHEGGDMLQPMAVAGIGGLLLTIPVAMFLVPCLYVIFTRRRVEQLPANVMPVTAVEVPTAAPPQTQ